MIMGALRGVSASLIARKPPGVKLVVAATPEALLDDFAAAAVDWIVWSQRPRVEVAVACEVVCAARPVAASCIARGQAPWDVTAAGWCVAALVGGPGRVRWPAVRDLWLRAWARLLADGAERARAGGGLLPRC